MPIYIDRCRISVGSKSRACTILTLAVDLGVRCWRAAVTDVLAVEVVGRLPVKILLIAAADEVTTGHDALLHVSLAATCTFNTAIITDHDTRQHRHQHCYTNDSTTFCRDSDTLHAHSVQ